MPDEGDAVNRCDPQMPSAAGTKSAQRRCAAIATGVSGNHYHIDGEEP